MLQRILAVLRARLREFYRDRTGLSWNLLMPLLILVGFSVIFDEDANPVLKIGVLTDRPLAALIASGDLPLPQTPGIDIVAISGIDAGRTRVERHQLDLLYQPGTPSRYWINEYSRKGAIAERLLLASPTAERPPSAIRTQLSGRELRYVDWVMPGVLGMNLMFSCLWGVGWVVVRYRKNGVLRRLQATPLTAFEFLAAQVIGRMLVVVFVTLVVYLGAAAMIDFVMRGSHLLLFLTYLIGGAALTSMGLVIAARLRTEEVADGALNLLSWPMMVMSGVWFSLEDASPVAQAVSQVFPLTHLVSAARRIMLDGAGFLDVWRELTMLALLALVLLAASARMFRWN